MFWPQIPEVSPQQRYLGGSQNVSLWYPGIPLIQAFTLRCFSAKTLASSKTRWGSMPRSSRCFRWELDLWWWWLLESWKSWAILHGFYVVYTWKSCFCMENVYASSMSICCKNGPPNTILLTSAPGSVSGVSGFWISLFDVKVREEFLFQPKSKYIYIYNPIT